MGLTLYDVMGRAAYYLLGAGDTYNMRTRRVWKDHPFNALATEPQHRFPRLS